MGQKAAQSEKTRIGHLSKLNIYSEPDDVRRTGIICTVGPKTGTVEMLTKLRRYVFHFVFPQSICERGPLTSTGLELR